MQAWRTELYGPLTLREPGPWRTERNVRTINDQGTLSLIRCKPSDLKKTSGPFERCSRFLTAFTVRTDRTSKIRTESVRVYWTCVMIEAGKDNEFVNLFTKESHHGNLSVIYIVQNLFHQRKGNRSISLNSHYLVLFKNPRDKLPILTLAKQMYPSKPAWFIKEYEEAVRRPYGYLFVDLRPTIPERCRLRTNVLPGEERFDKGFNENKISQELLQYVKQQTLLVPPPISEMQRIQNHMDNLLYCTNLGEDKKRSTTCSGKTSF